MSATLADLEEHLSHALALVEQLQVPSELDLIDAQIAALTDRRIALLGGGLWLPTEPGDWSLLCGVAAQRGVIASAWDWGKDAAQAWEHGGVTVTEMAATFGPDWEHVVAFQRKVASLTSAEREAWIKAWRKVYNANRSAYDAAWRAVGVVGSGPGGAARRALGAFGVVGYGYDVGCALARRSEIADEPYEILTRAAREHFGPIHPDDPS